MTIQLDVLGAGQEVGRSGFVMRYKDQAVMMDYGLKINADETEMEKDVKGNTAFPLETTAFLDAVILSHAHLDHSGYIPHLFSVMDTKLYMTKPTSELSEMLWYDTLKIANAEGNPLPFTPEDINRTVHNANLITYRSAKKLSTDIKMELFDAGHILGSAMTKLSFNNKSLLYTGDFKKNDTRLFKGADLKSVGNIDYLLIESTYGDRNHPPREIAEQNFIKQVRKSLDSGGNVLIPSFAIGRSQEVLNILHDYGVEAEMYLDGMGQRASNIFLQYPKGFRDFKTLRNVLNSVKWVKRHKQRQNLLEDKEGVVVVTTAGMLQGGPAMAYIPQIYQDPNSSILLTGYQVEGTKGHKLLESGEIEIDGEVYKLKTHYEQFSFSAHPGQTELLDTIVMTKPEHVVCIHGDDTVTPKFAKKVESEIGINAYAPKIGEELRLD